MSNQENDTTEIEVETSQAEPDVEVVVEEPEVKTEEKPVKKDAFVKTDDEEAEARIKSLYRQTKAADRRNEFYLELIEKQQARLDALEQTQNATLQQESEKVLRQRLQEARDNDDIETEIKVLKEISALQQSSVVPKKEKEAEKKVETTPYDEDTVYFIADKAKERNDSGELVRPWLYDDNPHYATTIAKANKIAAKHADPKTGIVHDMEAAFDELDQEMSEYLEKKSPKGGRPNSRTPDPLQGGNLTNTQTKGKIKLSAAEVSYAKKLGVSLESYAKSKE